MKNSSFLGLLQSTDIPMNNPLSRYFGSADKPWGIRHIILVLQEFGEDRLIERKPFSQG